MMKTDRFPIRRAARCLTLCMAGWVVANLAGCSGIEKAPPQPVSNRSDKSFALDVPEIMRGTVGSETIIRGYQSEMSPGYRPTIGRGYGLVVGLKGTGSRDIPPQLRQYMIQEAARGGVGSEKFGQRNADLTPEQLLDSPDTAVVIVEAVIPQGAPEGTRFDVRVYAVPSSGTTSLEGGTLWTTLLRPGNLAMGGKQAAELATAYGPVFINPFTEPGSTDNIQATAGRVMEGGEVIKDMPLKLQLANPSHARAQVLVTAINTRFPEDPGQKSPTARGESDESIEINVPPSWFGRQEEFVQLLMHTTIAQANPEAAAMYVRRTLLASPAANAEPASWRWQALGPRVLPMIKDLYDYPDEYPRLAALRAGAKLDDGLVIPYLIDMAEHGSTSHRLEAVDLLEGMRANPQIDVCLRKLLNDDDVELRLQSYEALVERLDPLMDRYSVDGKFVLDVIESDKPLIYITQVGQPRIAVFGKDLALPRPMTMTAWSNRLMIKADADQPDVEVFYRDLNQQQPVILHAKADLADFVQFLAHKTSIEEPAPGLNLTYSETVNALHQIWLQKKVDADFKLQQDRILAMITRIQNEGPEDVAERPELADPRDPPATPNDPTSDLSKLSDRTAPVPTNNPQALPTNLPPKPDKPGN